MKLWHKFTSLFRRKTLDADMAEEMRLHLEARIAENIANGMSLKEARHVALRRFGGVDQVKELAREQRSIVWLEQTWQDLRYAARSLAKTPGFTAVVVLTLALGIGATTAIYSVVNGLIFNPVPGSNPERIVQIGEYFHFRNDSKPTPQGVSPPVLQALVAKQDFFLELAWYDGVQLERRTEDFTIMEHGSAVSPNFFALLGASPMLGRAFTPDEAVEFVSHAPAQDAVMVISYAWWKSHFGGDRGVLGRTIELGSRRFTIIGVMPAYFNLGGSYWLPAQPIRPQARRITSADIYVFARLQPEVSDEQTQAMLDTLKQQLLHDYPGDRWGYGQQWRESQEGLRLWAQPLQELVLSDMYQARDGGAQLRRTLFGLLGAIGFVLLIVCANVANLTLARTERRQQEFAIRAALGAGRGRLMRQLLTENILLACLGGVGGLLLADWGMQLLLTLNPTLQLRPIEMDGSALAIAGLVTLLTVLFFGLLPAWRAGRTQVSENLSSGAGVATAGGAKRRQQSALVVVQVALTVVLLAGAGLMIQSVVRLLRVEPGFDPTNLISVALRRLGGSGSDFEGRNVRLAVLHERIAALPGVGAVGIVKDGFQKLKVVPEGRTEPLLLIAAHCGVNASDFFRAAGIPLVAGRYFESGDIGEGVGTVIVNETFAQLCWPGENAVGKTFRVLDRRGEPTYEVIGVAQDARFYRFNEEIRPLFYRPYHETGRGGSSETLVVRTQRDPGTFIATLRRELKAAAPDMGMPYISLYRQSLYDSTRPHRIYRNYLVTFAGVGLLLSALGVYGVLAYSVARRTREIGIRMAIGAEAAQVVRMVMGEGVRLVAIGVAIGVLAAFWLTRFLRHQLFDVSPTDPGALIGATVVLAAVALVACWLPARRAAKVDPMTALRCE